MKFKEIKKCRYFLEHAPLQLKKGAFALLETLNQGEECALNAVDILRSSDVDYECRAYEWSLYYQCGSFHIQEVTVYPDKRRVETYSRAFATFHEALEEFDSLDWQIVY